MLKIDLSLKPLLIFFLGLCLSIMTGCAKEVLTKETEVFESTQKTKKDTFSEAPIKSPTRNNTYNRNNTFKVDTAYKVNNSYTTKKITKTKTKIKTPQKTFIKNVIQKDQVWLLIDTQKQRLEVKQGKRTLEIFDKIAIGRNGAGFKNKRGDNITPLGTYKIGWVNEESKYHIFYGFTYPSVENAKEALKKDLISESVYNSIVIAHENDQIPPQYTSLGGRIGLHGIGSGSQKVHESWNWTQGCTAITNEQIDELSQWIVKGMTVKVK